MGLMPSEAACIEPELMNSNNVTAINLNALDRIGRKKSKFLNRLVL